MNPKISIIFVALFFPLVVFTQIIPLDEIRYTDSLERKLNAQISDSERAVIQFTLLSYWSKYDTLKAQKLLDSSQQLFHGTTFKNGLYNYAMGNYYFDHKDFDQSGSYYKKADSILTALNSKEVLSLRAGIWKAYAAVKQSQDDEEGFVDYLLNKSIPLAKRAGDSNLAGIAFVTIGMAFMNKLEFKKAAEYYQEGIALIKMSSPVSDQALVFANNESSGNYVELDSMTKAKQRLDETRDILNRYPASRYAFGYYYNAGYYFQKLKNYDSALVLYNNAVNLAEKFHEDYNKQRAQFLKYVVYREKKDYKGAVHILMEIINNNLFPTTNNRLTLYHEISDTYVLMKNMPEAYKWLNEYTELRDSLYMANVANHMNELDTKYRTAEKEKKILTLQSEKDKAALQSQRGKWMMRLLITGCGFILIISIFSFIYYQRISKQRIKEIEQEQKIALSQAMLEGEQRERKRVARELHDGLGGMLSGMRINLSGWASGRKEIAQDRNLNKVILQLDSSVSELRRIARDMMPETLLKFGLEIALKDLCEFYMGDKTHIDFQAFSIEDDLPLNVQINIYRIVQEILTNAIRHADATIIVLQCSQDGNNFYITIEDNGKGFDVSQLSDKKGMGMDNLKNRVEYLKGKIEILSKSGEGTTINIELKTDATV